MYNIKEVIGTLLVVFAVLMMLFGLIAGVGYWTEKAACEQLGRRTKQIVLFEYPSGCYILQNGHWLPLSFAKSAHE
jgi:hypothetical protein